MISNGTGVRTDERGRELVDHGTALFPIACYQEDVAACPVPWHWHEDWEIILAAEGSFEAATDTRRITVPPGRALFLDAGTLHEITAPGGRCEIRSAVFHPRLVGGMDSIFWQRYVEPVLRYRGSLLLDPAVPWQGECVELFQRAWQAMAEEAPGYELDVRAALSRMIFLIRENRPQPGRGLSPAQRRDTRRVKEMLAFIREHYGQEITVADVARSALVSESECLRCFRKVLDTSPSRYLRAYRIQRAADLLAGTDERTGEIGARCGYPDAAYFIKVFREVQGCTPGEYRKKRKESRQTP